jgi:hypothetical protein
VRIRAAVVAALARNGIKINDGTASATDGPMLTMRFVADPARDGVRRAQWQLSFAQDGIPGKRLEHTSALPAAGSAGLMTAFAEAAALANLRQIEGWATGSQQP